MADYKISLGVQLQTDDIISQINEAERKVDHITIKVDAETKELTKSIQDALKTLSGGTKNALTLDTSKLETSLNDVTSTIKEIKVAMGTLDSGSGMKSLVSSINSISVALDKASDKFDELVADLKTLSSKDFSVNIGVNMGKSNSFDRNTNYGIKARNDTLPQLKKQAEALQDYLKQYYKVNDEYNAILKLTRSSGNFKIGGEIQDLYSVMSGYQVKGNKPASLSDQMDAYKRYIGIIKEYAALNNIDLSHITSGFSKSADQLVQDANDVRTGANEMEDSFEKLKQIFGGGNNFNVEGISTQLDSIVTDLNEIKTVLQNLSSGTSLDGLTATFDRLSGAIENLLTNAERVRGVLGDNLSTPVADSGTEKVIQDQRELVQVSRESSGVIGKLKTTLETMRVDRSSIETAIKDMEELGFTATNTSVKMKNGGFDITVNGVDNIGRAITEIRHLDTATDTISLVDRKISQPLAETDKFIKQQKKSVADLTNQINQMNRTANDPNASRPIKDSSHLDSLKAKYNEIISAIERMENASSDTFVDEQNNVRKLISEYKSLVSEYKNAENVSTKMKGTDFGSGLDIAKNDLEKFKAEAKDFPQITATVKELDKAIEGVGDAASLNKFNDQLRVARSELAKIKSETAALNRSEKVGINVSGLESKIADLQRISPEIDKFETEIDGAKVSVKSLIDDLQQVKTQGDFSVVNARFKAFKEAASAAGIAVTEVAQKVKSINDIKIKISDTGFNGFEQEVLRARNAVEELEGVYPDLESALKRLDAAMADVYSADEAGDVKKLVAANEEYEAALKQVYSQLKLNQQAEQKTYKAELLNQKKAALSSEMETWLKENTRAAKDFGDEIRRLQASLNGLDDKGVKLVGQQFKTITKQAQAMGKTGLTTFDKLKSKVKEYTTYLSAAEMFMYAEQALRSMFEQVKLIDSAMTELKKVTDETDASYNQFLSNAAQRSKELGTTIDGLVSSTADFARLGYSFEDSQGLAEVANIYAVVGDEIEGVEGATESLISTMAAFKDEMNGMSNSDFAMRIIDSFNELGNNFAISSGGIGEALERSASSLAAANNNLHESAALITAAM